MIIIAEIFADFWRNGNALGVCLLCFKWSNAEAFLVRIAAFAFGPHAFPDNALAISPRTYDDLAMVKALVSRAPHIPGWKFFAGKPAKELLSLTFYFEMGRVVADSWTYRLTAYNNYEFVDIELFYSRSTAPPPGLEETAAETVVESLIGEEMRLDKVGYIEPKEIEAEKMTETLSDIWSLKPHLEQIFSLSS